MTKSDNFKVLFPPFYRKRWSQNSSLLSVLSKTKHFKSSRRPVRTGTGGQNSWPDCLYAMPGLWPHDQQSVNCPLRQLSASHNPPHFWNARFTVKTSVGDILNTGGLSIFKIQCGGTTKMRAAAPYVLLWVLRTCVGLTTSGNLLKMRIFILLQVWWPESPAGRTGSELRFAGFQQISCASICYEKPCKT